MTLLNKKILTINAGSSSIKFALFEGRNNEFELLFSGKLSANGKEKIMLKFNTGNKQTETEYNVSFEGKDELINKFIDLLEDEIHISSVYAIGHRIVYGIDHTVACVIDDKLLSELKRKEDYAPEHLPLSNCLISEFRKRYPLSIQIACSDSAFHAGLPEIAQLLPIPLHYRNEGIKRFGFHGISCAYVTHFLQTTEDANEKCERVIIAHLGNGSSITALKDFKSVDTSMGFTPSSGLAMGTRSGDMDPGLILYLLKSVGLNYHELNDLINHQSGLLGISSTSGDIKELLQQQHTNHAAKNAVGYFCYQIHKWIGSFVTVLNGIQSIVFTGGIGENIPEIRTLTCRNLGFLGVELDENKNLSNSSVISKDDSGVTVRVIKTNEELMIAKYVSKLIRN